MNLILKLYALVGAISLCSSVIYANDTNEQIIQPAPSSTSSGISLPEISITPPVVPSSTSSATDTKTHPEITYEERLKKWSENYFKNVKYTFHQSHNNYKKPKKNKALKKLSKALCGDEDKPVYLITVTAPLNTGNNVYDFSCYDHAKPHEGQNFLTEQAFRGYSIIYDIGFILRYLCSANMPEQDNQDLLRLRSELAECAKLVLFNEFFFGRHYINTHTFMHTLYPYISTGCDNTLFYPHSAFFYSDQDSPFDKYYSDKKRNSYFTSGDKPTSDITKPICVNISYSIHNGTVLTRYKKASFCNEFVGYTGRYEYGYGYDEPLRLDVSSNTENALSLQKVLLENIGTEICFDLFCKVRRMNNWSNDNGKSQIGLLLLQSGCIDPVGKVTYVSDSKNINNLPISTANRDIYILQADASYNPVAGSHLFKIDSTGGPILYDPYCTIDLSERCPGLKITIYKVD